MVSKGNRMSNTPVVKEYDWKELIFEAGVYQPLDVTDYLIIILDKKIDGSEPDDILLYNTSSKRFSILPLVHLWYTRKYIKCGLELKLV
jgi:hypothetical protein